MLFDSLTFASKLTCLPISIFFKRLRKRKRSPRRTTNYEITVRKLPTSSPLSRSIPGIMPNFNIHNPLPSSLKAECKKAGRILASFVDPRQAFGPDKVIPPQILANAKGLAIVTVLKAGFLGSGRFGSGVVVARLSDGSWSAPSAIATVGGGFGGQIGFELTDFVFILNNTAAVKTFAQQGSLQLGANVSLAAGPVGRNAEAAGTASLKSVAAVFAYSKTKGLFAGVSLEGGGLIERRDANEKEYGSRIKAVQLLDGGVRPTASADPLMRVLNSRVFAGVATSSYGNGGDSMYNDIPVYDDRHDDVVWEGRRGSAYGEGVPRDSTIGGGDSAYNRPTRASTWQDDVYDRDPSNAAYIPPSRSGTFSSRANPSETFDAQIARRNTASSLDNYSYSDNPHSSSTMTTSPKPSRPTAPKPTFKPRPAAAQNLEKNQAIALFTFDADQPGDLGFKKGEVITIIKRTEGAGADWWTGRIGEREGTFPR